MSTAGLILAAGESRRMGSPKALLEYRGETFLGRLVRLMAARCAPVIVVLGAAEEEIRARAPENCTLVWNADYRSGQTGSMQCGLRAVPPGVEGVLFTLVDHPAVAGETIEALTAGDRSVSVEDARCGSSAGRACPAPTTAVGEGYVGPEHRSLTVAAPKIRVPRYGGRRGHPIWFSAELIAEFLALPPDGAARDVVRAHAEETGFLDVEDAGILADIDDPAAYRMLTGAGR